MTAQTQNFQYVPLNNLVVSPRNVRRKDRKADIDALAASISSRGLLQNLCVVAQKDRFEVDAGGRRLMALKKLAKDGLIAKDFPVPCHIVASEDGREVVRRLAQTADIVLENFLPGALDGIGLGYAALSALNPPPDLLLRHGLWPDRPVARPARV